MYLLGNALGPGLGSSVVFLLLCGAAVYMWLHWRKKPIGHHNVTDDWSSSKDSGSKGNDKHEVTV